MENPALEGWGLLFRNVVSFAEVLFQYFLLEGVLSQPYDGMGETGGSGGKEGHQYSLKFTLY